MKSMLKALGKTDRCLVGVDLFARLECLRRNAPDPSRQRQGQTETCECEPCVIDAFPFNGPGTSNGARPAGRDRVLQKFACRMSASRRKKGRKTLTFLV